MHCPRKLQVVDIPQVGHHSYLKTMFKKKKNIYICTYLNVLKYSKDFHYVLTGHEWIVNVSSVKITNFDCIV